MCLVTSTEMQQKSNENKENIKMPKKKKKRFHVRNTPARATSIRKSVAFVRNFPSRSKISSKLPSSFDSQKRKLPSVIYSSWEIVAK